MPKPVIDSQHYDGRDLSNVSLGEREYRNCTFLNTNCRGVNFEDATLLNCNLSGFDPINSTFRFSCQQGNGNVLDELRANMFLYWMLHMFKLEPSMRSRIESILGRENLLMLSKMFSAHTPVI